ncbi:MAG: glycogen synthase [Deltaproteobacteria bacterium]|nr:glycogen synthase [Deltaproteobacteria bacterium]MBS1243920.1 glycogen synthase [Deltaproteobacteria bacterium]
MRVMQLIQSLARGGAERLTLDLALGLGEAGHEVLVVTLQDENAHDELEYVSVEKRSLHAGESFRWPWYLPRAASRLSALLRAWKPHLVFTHTQNISVVAALAIPGLRVIQVFHTYWEAMAGTPAEQWRRRMLAQWTFGRLGRRGVVVARPLVENSVRHLGCSPDRIRCVPNGIRLDRFPFAHRSAPVAIPRIGTVGSLTEFKRPDLAIRAFALLKETMPGARLSIVGEGPLRGELERLRGELDLMEDVELPGVCSDVPARLASWDLYWQLSRLEGGSPPLAVAEAMATGVPVVVSDVPGLREGVIDGKTGLRVPPCDIRGVADRSAELLASPARYGEIAAEARRYVERHHDFRWTVAGYVEVAEDVLSGRW